MVDRDSNLLLGAQVALGRLDRGVPEQKLDLLEIASRIAAQLGTGAAEVVSAEVLEPDLPRAALDHRPDRLVANGRFAHLAGFRYRPQQGTFGNAGCLGPAIDTLFHPKGDGDGTDPPSFPTRSMITVRAPQR